MARRRGRQVRQGARVAGYFFSSTAVCYFFKNSEKALEYIAGQEKLLGTALDETIKKQYYNAFTKPQFKDNADLLWKQHQKTVELTASAKAKEDALVAEAKAKADELAAVKSREAKLTETLSQVFFIVPTIKHTQLTSYKQKVGKQVGGMRASYAQSLSSELTPAQTEAAKVEDDANRKLVGVSASRGLGNPTRTVFFIFTVCGIRFERNHVQSSLCQGNGADEAAWIHG